MKLGEEEDREEGWTKTFTLQGPGLFSFEEAIERRGVFREKIETRKKRTDGGQLNLVERWKVAEEEGVMSFRDKN